LGPETNVPDLPPYSLDVQALELGADTKAVGLELLETQSREPLRGSEAAQIWAAAFSALAAKEMLPSGFFSVTSSACANSATPTPLPIVRRPHAAWSFPYLSTEQLGQLFARFGAATFGMRAGPAAQNADPALENELSLRGLDAYQQPIRATLFAP